jgi:hypothetical protein
MKMLRLPQTTPGGGLAVPHDAGTGRRHGFMERDFIMRRLFLSLLGLCGLALAGCEHYCTHGACDCCFDDHCCSRSPWVSHRPPAVLGAPIGAIETIPAPMPPAKEMPKGGQ